MVSKDQLILAVENRQYYRGSKLVNIKKDEDVMITDFKFPKHVENKYKEILKIPEFNEKLIINNEFILMSMKNFLCSYIVYGEINGFNCSIYLCKGQPFINILNSIDIGLDLDHLKFNFAHFMYNKLIAKVLFNINLETRKLNNPNNPIFHSNNILSEMYYNSNVKDIILHVHYLDKENQNLITCNIKTYKKLQKKFKPEIYEQICTIFEEELLREL